MARDLNALTQTFGLNIFGFPEISAEILNFNEGNAFGLAVLGHAGDLNNTNNVAVQQLSSFISNAFPPVGGQPEAELCSSTIAKSQRTLFSSSTSAPRPRQRSFET